MSVIMTNAISNCVRATIDQGISESQPKVDPVFGQISRTSIGVSKSSIGFDWKAKHIFSRSMSGAHEWTGSTGEIMGGTLTLDGSAGGDGLTIYGEGSTWPTLSEMAGPGYVERSVSLVRGKGNFPVPFTLLRADKLDASIGSQVAQIIKGTAKRHALSRVHAFWKTHANDSIGTAVLATDDLTTTPKALVLASGRVGNFFPGLFLDVYSDVSGAPTDKRNTTYKVVVTSVDYLAKTIYLRTIGGNETITAATVNLVPRKGKGNGPSGLVDWVKNNSATGESIFGIDLDSDPQFRSIVETESGTLTSGMLNKYIASFEEAYDTQLDTIITTQGVLMSFLDNIDGTQQLLRYDATNKALAVKAGFQPIGYVFNGRPFKIMTSKACPKGTVWVLKLNDKNIKEYVPPRLDRAGSDSRINAELEFVAPILGSANGIFMPITVSDAVTDVLQAPYLDFCNFCPEDPRSIKLSNLDEDVFEG